MRSAAVLTIVYVLFSLTGIEVFAQGRGDAEFRPGAVRGLQDLPASRFRLQLDRLPAAAQQRAVAWLNSIHFTTQDLTTMHADSDGGIYFADPAPEIVPEADASVPGFPVASASVAVSPFPASLVFHSRPGAPNVIYLNFTGETVSGTEWNTTVGRTSIPAVAFSTDSDLTTFSDADQLAIRRIWQRVAEDYAAFNVDVTTERPATFSSRTAHALITRHTDANGADNPASGSGGVAYVGVFGGTSYARYRPAWIYYDNFGSQESYVAEAVSHEVGHNLGLTHDGKTDGTEYYQGHGSGETSWGPVMGTGYNRNVSQWSKGEYYAANNTQDDLATIAGKLSYRTDDFGNTLTSATALSVGPTGQILSTTPDTDPANTNTVNKGVLERSTDVDWFSFAAGTGPISLSVKPCIVPNASTRGGNVDLVLELYNAAGQLLLTNNAVSATVASVQTNLTEGIYYISIKGTEVGNPTASSPSGYTKYGSIGQYFISGSVVPSGIVIPPGAELTITDITEPGVGAKQFSVTYSDDLAIDVASIGNDDVHVTGPNGYSSAAVLVSLDIAGNGTPRTATYAVDPAAGGTWAQRDNGVYSVVMQADSVFDTQGEAVPSRTLGTFNVAVPSAIYAASMETNPGWTLQGLWQFGAPRYTGGGPTSGFTGNNILAYNLSGDYENRLAPTYATTPVIDCAGVANLTLRFRRWLRLRNGDTASIQVSTDGSTWLDVWASSRTVSDSSWQLVQYTLPSSVAGSSSLRLRWGISSGQSQNDIGWNIDDVVILGNGVVDTVVPTATLNAANLLAGGSPTHSITVTYSDDSAVSVNTLGSQDLLVVGPGGTNTVEFDGADVPEDGTPRTAVYSVMAPNGVWQAADNGDYEVYLQDGEVADTSNNTIEGTLLGRFTVAIVANQLPTVTLTAPTDGATFEANSGLILSADSNDEGEISRVEFYAQDIRVGEVFVPPYTKEITLAPGTYSITAKAFDNLGASTVSQAVTITVYESAEPPQVTSVNRAGNSTVVTLRSASGSPHVLEVTSDFTNWTPVATNAPISGSVTFSHPTSEPQQAYRVRVANE